jgi:hypothetical protein
MSSVDLSLMTQVFSERYSSSLATFKQQPRKVDSLTEDGQAVDIVALAENSNNSMNYARTMEFDFHYTNRIQLRSQGSLSGTPKNFVEL